MNNLELLHEGFKNELDEIESLKQRVDEFVLKSKRYKVQDELAIIISNLNQLCDSLYVEFENSNNSELEELQEQNAVMLELLAQYVPDEDRTYIKLKYQIEIAKGF